jgi:hypothetical protein
MKIEKVNKEEKKSEKDSAKLAAIFLGSAIIYPLLHIAFTIAKARSKK